MHRKIVVVDREVAFVGGINYSADHLLDFGPEGGQGGGTLVAKGTPEEVANNKNSHTGKYLKKVLK